MGRIVGCLSDRGACFRAKILQDAPFDVCDRSGAMRPSLIPMRRARCPDAISLIHTRGFDGMTETQTQRKVLRPKRVSARRRVIGSARTVVSLRRRSSRVRGDGRIRHSIRISGGPLSGGFASAWPCKAVIFRQTSEPGQMGMSDLTPYERVWCDNRWGTAGA